MTSPPENSENWLDTKTFTLACSALPLVSIDWVISNSEGKMLLGLRRNAPAKNWWFTPGGRIRKNETLHDAGRRISENELGVSLDIHQAKLMGVWDHLYDDSAFSATVSTHYVNLPHWLTLEWQEIQTFKLKADEQHLAWKWAAAKIAAEDPTVHPYVQNYAKWLLVNTA
jgi:colanic acid biosynthesis protein WcaH